MGASMTMNKNVGAVIGLMALAGLAILGLAAVKTKDGKHLSGNPDRRGIVEKCESIVSRLERECQNRAA